ncbi:MAG: hypothetical protein ACTSV3_05515 [Candidatus Thorarchaeota archaeon]|nr:MAG: hypothetical protein DRP09_06560 [Candidatus Thorarchaeota archaeon]RLI59774.1 MAG: hypothetical protein DRO87_01820 [Candidatus Thorarchaeota archaeon]
MSEKRESIINEEERKRLVTEIGKIKDVLDSFKYGLNFEDFADSLFSTVDRQTIAVKQLDEKMTELITRMTRLEERLNEGIKVTVSGVASSDMSDSGATEVTLIEEPEPEVHHPAEGIPREKVESQIADLKIKIARLFEKENELAEMSMNDPAGADEYDEKAAVVKDKRVALEEQLESLEKMLE